MTWAIRGLIEGFYGLPWTWDERLIVTRACAERGMTHYVYAPKDDPKHRSRWRELYSHRKLEGFDRLLSGSGLTIGFAIAPGLDIDPDDPDDRAALAAKVDQVVGVGVPLVVLALDDLPPDHRGAGTRGVDHATLATWLRDHLADRAALALVPTEYVGTERSPYLDALAREVPDDVPIGWTGRHVVNDEITAADARMRAASLGGRPPLLWDNYPVNDALMSDRLFLGPLWGREPDLADVCSGYLANAMVQPRCSLLPLASVAAFVRGDDPLDGWAAAAGGLQVFAEACDGSVPLALARLFVGQIDGPGWYDAARPLADWLHAAARCGAPGLEGEADDWLEQVHQEARITLAALRLLQAIRPAAVIDAKGAGRVIRPDLDAAAAEAFGLSLSWPRAHRSTMTVFGVRSGFRPVVGQWPNGQWRFEPSALEHGRNATDLLVRSAFAALADGPSPTEAAGSVEVLVDGEPVTVADDDTFRAPAGATVVVRVGRHHTTVTGPADALPSRP